MTILDDLELWLSIQFLGWCRYRDNKLLNGYATRAYLCRKYSKSDARS